MSNLREGVVLVFAHEGKVLTGQRASMTTPSFQFPQGGRDIGEDLWATVVREANEELGLDEDQFKLVMRLPQETEYVFPDESLRRDGYEGQRHTWFLLELVNPGHTFAPTEEFSSFKWVYPETAYREVVSFKKQAYAQALNLLGLLMVWPGRHFWLSNDDLCKISDWRKTLPPTPKTAIGGAVTFSFTPTTLGTAVRVTNRDGSVLDLTDYEDW